MIFSLISSSCATIEILSNLTVSRQSGFNHYQNYYLDRNHHGRETNQRPSEWTNITLKYSKLPNSIQMTGWPKLGSLIDKNKGALSANIPNVELLDYYQVKISVKWWDEPWTLYIGSIW